MKVLKDEKSINKLRAIRGRLDRYNTENHYLSGVISFLSKRINDIENLISKREKEETYEKLEHYVRSSLLAIGVPEEICHEHKNTKNTRLMTSVI